jgi:hypothetical protein
MYKKSYRPCKHCTKDIVSSRHNDHESKCLVMQSTKLAASQRTAGHQVGKPAWNKGLNKDTDARVLQYTTANTGKSSPNRGKKLEEIVGEERAAFIKKNTSRRMSVKNKGGRSKWYEVAGQKCQGTWERNVALKFEELGIAWTKLTVHKDILEYVMDGKVCSYTPDFYLPAYDVFLEVKGYWWGRDREKMDIVLKTYPDKHIVIVEKDQYEKFLGGELVW